MKRSFFLLLLAVLSLSLTISSSAFSLDVQASSKISAITVYSDRAMITREAEINVPAGSADAVFDNIIPEIDENSIKVTSGSDSVKIFGASVKKDYVKETPSVNIKTLEDSIQGVQDQMRAEEQAKSILSDEKRFLDSIRLCSAAELPKEMVTKMPSPGELDGILTFLDTKLKDNYKLSFESDIKLRDLSKKLEALQNELSQSRNMRQKMKRSIRVALESAKNVAVNIKVSYIVYGASWEPIYDARASFDKNSIELVSYGIVRQTTGEDWDNVEMSLSTSKPVLGGNMPEAEPWFIRVFKPVMYDMEMQKAAPRALLAREMKKEEASDYAGGSVTAAQSPVNYAKPEEKGVAVLYKLSKPASVKADGSEQKLPINEQTLNAKFEYSAYPRAVDIVYLRSKVTNQKGVQLLSGNVNVFFEGDFVGTSFIKNIAPGEEFELYLGADENVKVKRELLEKKSDDVLIGNIPSATITEVYKYKLSLENYKSKDIKVNLFDSLPVSEDEKIKVKISDVSLEPGIKDWKDKKGVWLWQMAMKPKEKFEIFYTVTVSYPRGITVEGL